MKKRALIFFIMTCLWRCLPAAAQTYDLYYSNGAASGGIRRLDLENPSSSSQQVVNGSLLNTSTGIAIDSIEQKLYWIADTQFGSTDKVRRSNLDGTNVELLFTSIGQPADLEIDPYARKLYRTERVTNSIIVSNLDGSGQQTIISTTEPRGMDLDLVNQKIYWVEFQSNKLRSANFDGSGIGDVITTGMSEPFDVTIDPTHNRLYWVELGPNDSNGKVWTANLNGTNKTLIAQNQLQPSDLILDLARNSIYWGDENGSRLWRADLDGSNVLDMPVPHDINYRNMALDVLPVPDHRR